MQTSLQNLRRRKYCRIGKGALWDVGIDPRACVRKKFCTTPTIGKTTPPVRAYTRDRNVQVCQDLGTRYRASTRLSVCKTSFDLEMSRGL